MKKFNLILIKILMMFLLFNYSEAQDGTIDSSFAIDGHTMTQVLEDKRSASTDIIVLEDGKVLASGTYDNFGRPGLVVVRYNPDGSVDTSFGEEGFALTFFADTQVEGVTNTMALQSDGKIVLSGYSTSAVNYDMGLARLTADGKIDSSFGNNGSLLISLSDGHDYAYDMAIQDDDNIVLAGRADKGCVVRLLPDGQLDSSFGDNGVARIKIAYDDEVVDLRVVKLQSNGKIIAGGYFSYWSINPAIVKLNSDGSYDNSFAGDGRMVVDELSQMLTSIVLLNGNQMLVLGSDGGSNVELAKINPDSTLVSNFGTNGIIKTNFVSSVSDGPVELIVQNDNKFIVVATTWEGGPKYMSGQRFNSDGSVDNSFGDSGAFYADLTGQNFSRANAATMAEDGSIFISGATMTEERIMIFTVLKINNNSQPLVSVENDQNVKKDFKLFNNYPNPFNPSTTIRFSLAEPSQDVSIKIYDILGNEITTLLNGSLESGIHEVNFNAENLASGIYFYTLKTDTYFESKKMTLLK